MALVRFHGRSLSSSVLISGLPLVDNRLTPQMFLRAADRAGLSARLVPRAISGVPGHVLPVVVLLKGRSAGVLLRRDMDNCEILLPETGGGVTVMPIPELESLYAGYAFFVRPRVRMREVESGAQARPRGNWFWDTLAKFKGVYRQVVLSAIMINLFALAGPLFTMNVYDRVVPNNAVETLWVLAVGMGIVYGFDFILKLLRSYLVDHAGKRADVMMSARIFEQSMNVRLQARPGSAGVFANHLKEFETVRDFFTSAVITALVDLPFIFLFLIIIALISGPVAWVPAMAVPLIMGAPGLSSRCS